MTSTVARMGIDYCLHGRHICKTAEPKEKVSAASVI